jgi:hypothetical protein
MLVCRSGCIWLSVLVASSALGQTQQSQVLGYLMTGSCGAFDENGSCTDENYFPYAWDVGKVQVLVTSASGLPDTGVLRLTVRRTSGDVNGSYDYVQTYQIKDGQVVNVDESFDYIVGFYTWNQELSPALPYGQVPDVSASTTEAVISAELDRGAGFVPINVVNSDAVRFEGVLKASLIDSAPRVGLIHVVISVDKPISVHGYFYASVNNDCDRERTLLLVVDGNSVATATIPAHGSGSVQYDSLFPAGKNYQWVLAGTNSSGAAQSFELGQGTVLPASLGNGEFSDTYFDEGREWNIGCDDSPSPTPSPSPSPSGTPTPLPSPSPTGTPLPSPTPNPSGTPFPSPTPNPSGTPEPSGTPGGKTFADVSASPSPDINGQGSRIGGAIDQGMSDAGSGMGDAVSQVQCWGSASFGSVTELPLPLSVFSAGWPSGIAVPSWSGIVRSVILWLEVVVGFMAGLKSLLSLKVQ